ncbi:MICOS complex subunit mic25a-like isoform X2 [Toxotes jaculatrix]|uniref:MICOS complex subunit mic25a-like isoform X2 n=1 Tax=Toxotes jaculatrix TaxID=941984 RepID=UPI001B3A9AC6|nr:MICOS complex subunit mic25a-like isoform X2 [Toxotes jaculatrix]
MGSGESTTRKVSFGVDDEDRVRILRGVKLSEDVLQRMRGVANIAPERTPSSASSTQKDPGVSRSASSSTRPRQNPQHRAQPNTQSKTNKPDSYAKEEQRRYEQQQAIFKEELAKVAQREREAAMQEMIKTMSRERQHTHQEAEKFKQLNLERYEQSKDQFHQAASKTEANVRSRNIDPVCSGLQAQILSCYRENRDQTLRCSDLAKEYMQCINAAKKNLLVNHG